MIISCLSNKNNTMIDVFIDYWIESMKLFVEFISKEKVHKKV